MKNRKFLNQFICGNAAELLTDIKDESVDLIITSPPYDNLRTYQGYSFPFEAIASECSRILTEGGVIVWVINDATIKGSETGTSFKQALYFLSLGLNLHDTMIFRKVNAIPQIYRKRYTNEFEYMFVFSKGYVKTHNAIRIPCLHAGLKLETTTYKNYSRGVQKRKKLANPVKKDKIRGNIWEYVVGKRKEDQFAKHHPAPFPVKLAIDHINSWTNEGDVVLDPMCGVGTACLASKMLKRKYIGLDISAEYCRLSEERIEEWFANKDLFINLGDLGET